MSQTDNFETSFLTSSLNPPRHGYFQGYCFVGSDLVFGTAGARYYKATTGKMIEPALDGCYVTVRKINENYLFDVDFAGYKILYYYHDGHTWAVSSSFAQIVDFLRAKKLKITPNYPHLAAIGGRGMASSQLFSLETPVRGVRVVPRTHTLIIAPTRPFLRERPRPQHKNLTYSEALSAYVNNWVSRFETLMLSQETNLTIDLTGGVDSRANFALMRAAQNRLGTQADLPTLHCESTSTSQIDEEVARTIADTFNLTVQNNRESPEIPLSSTESFEMHRNHSLGVYYPLYIPERGPSPKDIRIGGGGGGIHRKTYELHLKSKDANLFIRRYSTYFKRPEYAAEFVRDGHEMLNTALQKGEDPLRVLLRDGRVRYHAGREARTGVAFTPLHSVSADQAQLLAGTNRIEEGQFNYDIMYSLDPLLMDMPYDSKEKSPTADLRKRLTCIQLQEQPSPGKIWAPVAHFQKSRLAKDPHPFVDYVTAFDSAINNPFVSNFWGKRMLTAAQEKIDILRSGIAFGNAADGKPISAILTADLVTPG